MWLKIPVELDTEAANVHLLKELDRWIEMGLLSDSQAIGIGRKLCSRLPITYKAPAVVAPGQDLPVADNEAAAGNTPKMPQQTPVVPNTPLGSRFKSRLVQSFLTEMSVLWLLFLGVFLVVVSSAVLAASQWQSFSVLGQYAILLVYTLAFGGASRWAAGQVKLQTTAQMLKAATLLLIPLNIWMMDALGVVTASAGLAILAGIGLSGLTLVLAPQRRTGLNLLGLSWLHWGWGVAFWPVCATYVGTVGSATHLLLPDAQSSDSNGDSSGRAGGILIAISLLILLVRSLWIAQVPIYQLGLACGICGWMLCRLKRPLWPLGVSLMFLGWFVAVGQQPLQAIGVSGFAIWLLVDRLQHQSEERRQLNTLTTLWLIGFQTCGLMWLTLPLVFRQGALAAVGQFSPQPVSAINFAGVWLYGYVALMLGLTRHFRRREWATWGRLTEELSLGISVVLVLFTLPQAESYLFTLSLTGLTVTLGMLARWRQSARLIYGTHCSLLATVLSGLYVMSEGSWTEPQWAMALLALTLTEWIVSVATGRYAEWRRSGWYLSIGLSMVAYGLLLNNAYSPPFYTWGSELRQVWLVLPCVLTWMVYRRQFATDRPQLATVLTVLALGGRYALLFSSWQMLTAVSIVSVVLLGLHSCRWPSQKSLPVITVSWAIVSAHVVAIWLWLIDVVSHAAQLWLVMAIFAAGLSLLTRPLKQSSRPLLNAYGIASRDWSHVLAIVLSLTLTLTMAWFYQVPGSIGDVSLHPDDAISLRYGAAAVTLMLARFFGQRRLANGDYWEAAYGLGLLVSVGISLVRQEIDPQLLGAAMMLLGMASQLMVTMAMRRHQAMVSWHYIPLAYGALGLGLGHLNFTATTGMYSIAVGLVTLATARRQLGLRSLSYGGLGMLSLGIYELVIHRMLQTSGGAPGDGLTLLALVGSAISLLYLLCSPWIRHGTRLTTSAIRTVSLLHWLLAISLAAIAIVPGQSYGGLWLWLGVVSLLSMYAWSRGNYRWFPVKIVSEARQPFEKVPNDHHSYKQWTWCGLIIATIAIPYAMKQLFPNLLLMSGGWGASLVCGLSLFVNTRLPWQRLGWPQQPWRQMALSWPILSIFLNATTIKTQGLLLVAIFYAGMARQLRTVRLSYLSLGLLNWSLLLYFLEHDWLTPLRLITLMGVSAMYILEVDPHWKPVSARQERHLLLCLTSLLVGFSAILQAEIASPVFIGFSLLRSFGLISFGLFRRVRAYLYIGTLTFMLQILRAIMMFIDTDGRMLWAVGIVLGIVLIWVAATFEARRTQIHGLLSRWSDMLNTWD